MPRSPLASVRRRVIAAAAMAAGVVACLDGPTAPAPLAFVIASPEAVSLLPLDTVRLSARVELLDGTPVTGRALTWRALDTALAEVEADGLVRARSYPGGAVRNTAIVVGTLGAREDTVPVEIRPWPVARVRAGPDTVVVFPRDSAQLSAVLESETGAALAYREVVWLSSDTAAIEMRSGGRLRARPYSGPAERWVFVAAWSEGKADTLVVRVRPLAAATLVAERDSLDLLPGQFDTLRVTARAAGGDTLSAPLLSWTSTDTTIATVNVEGVVLAAFYVGASTRVTTVVVRAGSVADTVRVIVHPLFAASVEIASPADSVQPGGTLALSAAVRDTDGLFLADRPVAWSSLDTTVARVSTAGVVTAQPYSGPAAQSVRIVATVASVADTVTLRVPPRSVAWLVATPEAVSFSPGDSVALQAAPLSLDLVPLTDRPVTFVALDTSVATVSTSGIVRARPYSGPALRSTAVIVSSGPAADTVPVSVLPVPAARVVATPPSVTLTVGDTAVLLAEVQDALGAPLTGREIAWVVSDTAMLSVSATGVLRAKPYVGPLTREGFAIVFGGGAADSVAVTVLPLTPQSLSVTPAAVTMQPGGLRALAAVLRSAAGDSLVDFPLTWRSTDTTVARVSVAGEVTASFYVGPTARSATIIAERDALADSVAVTVEPLAVSRVVVAPSDSVLLPSGSLQLSATVLDAAGLFLTGRPLTWTSSDTAVLTVSASGLVSARSYGGSATRTGLVIVESSGARDTLAITVTPHDVAWVSATPEALSLAPRDSAALSALTLAMDLTPLTGRSVQWQALDTTVATVSASGLVRARAYSGPALRSTSIVVTSGAAADTVPVSVSPLSVARVIATPVAITLMPGDTTTLGVALESADGTPLTDRTTAWLSSDTSALTVAVNGLATARPYFGPLERQVLAVVYAEGLADTVAVTIAPLTIGSVETSPSALTLRPGDTATVATVVRSTGGATLSDIPISWQSSDSAAASVNAAGVVTALFYVGASTRSVAIIAAAGAHADTTALTIEPLAIASVTIAAPDSSLLPGATLQLDVSVRDAAGLLLVDRPVTWTALDAAVATVDAAGLVTGAVYGGPSERTARVVAAAGAVSDTILLTLPAHSVAWVTATPEALALSPGDTATVTVALAALDLTPLTGRSTVWTSLDPSIATVDAAGLVTAVAYTGPSLRATNIVASSGAGTDTVPVSVAPLAVARVIAGPDTVDLVVGDSAELTASAESESGIVLSGRSFLWLTSDSSVATLSAAGVVTASPYGGALERLAYAVVYSEGQADTVVVRVAPLPPGDVLARASETPGDALRRRVAVRRSETHLSW